MKKSKQLTKKALRIEKLAKGVIRFFAFITLAVLVWIIGYILYKGFYTQTSNTYSVTPEADYFLRPYPYTEAGVFIAHRGVRITDITESDLLTIFTKPRKENWGFYTKQDLRTEVFAYKPGVSRSIDRKFSEIFYSYLARDNSDLPDYVNYVSGPEEMIERVAKTKGGVGYIPEEYFNRVKGDKRVRLIPVRTIAAAVNPGVMEMQDNRMQRDLEYRELKEIFNGKYRNWSELGGRDLPINIIALKYDPALPVSLYPYKIMGKEFVLPDHTIIAENPDDMWKVLEETPGALALGPFIEAEERGAPLLEIRRIEKGRNLTIRFLIEAPARSGQWGGISTIIINTLFLILFTLLFSVPIGVFAAIYMVEYAKQGRLMGVLRMGTETLAGIPSIVFGLFGHLFFVRILGFGIGFLSSTLTVTLMILPTLIRTAEEALKAVPLSFREGSLALGATKLQTTLRVTLPAAYPGILTGIILSLGRTVGETAVLLYTLGSSYELVRGPSSSARVLSLHLYMLFSEALSFERAFATGAVLVFIILIVNYATTRIISRKIAYSGKTQT